MDKTQFDRFIIASMAEGILFVDKDNKVSLCNEKAAELRSIPAEKVIGRRIDKCHQPSSIPAVFKVIDKLKKEPGSVHTRLVTVSGRTFEINYTAVFGKGAGYLGTLATSRDITEKIKLDKKLAKLSITDGLTGLFNHRYFYQQLQREMTRSKRYGAPLSLLLFDLDRFKLVNDTKGHAEGDRTLKKIGKLVRQNIRQHIDEAFRYGGDEFTIILPEADEDRAVNAAERLRKAIEKAQLDHVTLSIGIATYTEDLEPVDFVHIADQAMYRAKKQGGNQICLHAGECKL